LLTAIVLARIEAKAAAARSEQARYSEKINFSPPVQAPSSREQSTDATPPQLLTRKEVADLLNISLRHLDTLVASGEIVPVRIGRSVRFRPKSVEEFIEEAAEE
jgi:excisionase family DNA binding protein